MNPLRRLIPAGTILLAGLGLKALGRQEQARVALSRALQLDPASVPAQEELAALDELKKKESLQRPPRKPRKPLKTMPPLRSP